MLLSYPALNIDTIIAALDAAVIGIDLNWMVHVQGSLAVAEKIKQIHHHTPILFGGISSTYYAAQLMQYPFIDMVMRGYDTLQPMHDLLGAVKQGADLGRVPNLCWKTKDGQIQDNGLTYLPNSFSCGIDWSQQPQSTGKKTMPILEFLSTQNAGCAYNCPWCGGSREAFRRIYQRNQAMVRKPLTEISYELATMNQVANVEKYHFYSVGSYNESKQGMRFFRDQVKQTKFKSISYEQFHLTPDDTLQEMVQANQRTMITLSPESHDIRISTLAGRGVYTNDEMERWIEKALAYGIHQIDIWYFIGMPEQDEKSVWETVEYCHCLLDRFKGQSVHPMICPMIPFLDPASTFFENPTPNGYRVFYRTVEEHRRGMERASLINRINYETKWLSRHALVNVGFRAVQSLMQAKAERGLFPFYFAENYNAKITDALEFINVVHEADCITDQQARSWAIDELGDEILRRNQQIFTSGVVNQAFPINRTIGGRWFDELGWEPATLDLAQQMTIA